MREWYWFVMGKSGRTIDGAMPIVCMPDHDRAAEWVMSSSSCSGSDVEECWLEPCYSDIDGPFRENL